MEMSFQTGWNTDIPHEKCSFDVTNWENIPFQRLIFFSVIAEFYMKSWSERKLSLISRTLLVSP